jgi:hypothetical protein
MWLLTIITVESCGGGTCRGDSVVGSQEADNKIDSNCRAVNRDVGNKVYKESGSLNIPETVE